MADDESTQRTRWRGNWKRGLFRIWVVCAVGWGEAKYWWAYAHDPLAGWVRYEDLPHLTPGGTEDGQRGRRMPASRSRPNHPLWGWAVDTVGMCQSESS